MNEPLVSVILPLYNGKRFIASSIKSVLNQSYRSVELLVINDGSTDNSTDLIPADPRIRIFNRQNSGVAASRNFGIAQAKGRYLAFIDQDDYWYPDKLKLQMQTLLNESNLGYILTRMHNHLVDNMERPEWLKVELLEEDPVGILPSTLLVRHSVFDEIGTFVEALINGSDTEWFIRTRQADIQWKSIERVLVQRNIHEDNCSHDAETGKKELFSILRKKLKIATEGK